MGCRLLQHEQSRPWCCCWCALRLCTAAAAGLSGELLVSAIHLPPAVVCSCSRGRALMNLHLGGDGGKVSCSRVAPPTGAEYPCHGLTCACTGWAFSHNHQAVPEQVMSPMTRRVLEQKKNRKPSRFRLSVTAAGSPGSDTTAEEERAMSPMTKRVLREQKARKPSRFRTAITAAGSPGGLYDVRCARGRGRVAWEVARLCTLAEQRAPDRARREPLRLRLRLHQVVAALGTPLEAMPTIFTRGMLLSWWSHVAAACAGRYGMVCSLSSCVQLPAQHHVADGLLHVPRVCGSGEASPPPPRGGREAGSQAPAV